MNFSESAKEDLAKVLNESEEDDDSETIDSGEAIEIAANICDVINEKYGSSFDLINIEDLQEESGDCPQLVSPRFENDNMNFDELADLIEEKTGHSVVFSGYNADEEGDVISEDGEFVHLFVEEIDGKSF